MKDKLKIGIDGLVEVARRNGLWGIKYDYTGLPDAITITLFTKFGDHTDRWTLKQAKEEGRVKSVVWDHFPAEMLRRYALGKSIEKHFTGRLETDQEGK